jgi:hypothetical protein
MRMKKERKKNQTNIKPEGITPYIPPKRLALL